MHSFIRHLLLGLIAVVLSASLQRVDAKELSSSSSSSLARQLYERFAFRRAEERALAAAEASIHARSSSSPFAASAGSSLLRHQRRAARARASTTPSPHKAAYAPTTSVNTCQPVEDFQGNVIQPSSAGLYQPENDVLTLRCTWPTSAELGTIQNCSYNSTGVRLARFGPYDCNGAATYTPRTCYSTCNGPYEFISHYTTSIDQTTTCGFADPVTQSRTFCKYDLGGNFLSQDGIGNCGQVHMSLGECYAF